MQTALGAAWKNVQGKIHRRRVMMTWTNLTPCVPNAESELMLGSIKLEKGSQMGRRKVA
jgi:hypothetical protein